MSALVWFGLTAAFGWAEPSSPPESAEARQKAELKEFARWAIDSAASFDIRRAMSPDTPLTLRREPVLKWSNPERGRIYGHVFLWIADGRPEAVASLYKWYHPFTHSSYEFHSLSLGELSAKRDGTGAWSPSRPGVELRPVDDAPVPGKAAAARLRQMRTLAKRFRADETSREGELSQLRLLTQPIYRYENTKGELLDGAVFAYVQATDPEVLLLLEARLKGDGQASWQYALARLNGITMRAYYDGAKVWEAPELPWNVIHDQTEPYFTRQFPMQ